MIVVMVVGLSMMATGLKPLVFLGLFLHTIGQSAIRAVSASLIAGQALDRKGEIMGVLNSIMYMMTVVGAPLAGLVFGFGITWPYVLAAALSAGCLVVLKKKAA
jgi:MFS family permease